MSKPRIVAIVQARMGSTRLPGKVLKPIAGQPLLWHIVHRLRRSKSIGEIAIATSTNPRDDAIVEFGKENAVGVIRGPEDDVLARFALAAAALDPDFIVRVSSDAPFIEAGFIDHLLNALIAQDGDYVLLEEGAVAAHEGVDPFSRRALNKLLAEAHDDPVAREHVTGYFKQHPEFVNIVRAPAYPPLAREGVRLTIDTPDDLAFIEAIHSRMNAQAGEASLSDLLLLLEREPQLKQMNAHVKQKSLAARPALALIRCDGGGRFGYGHVKRMLSLARSMRDREGLGVSFAVNGTAAALEPIKSAGFEATLVNGARDYEQLSRIITDIAPDLLICDMREGAHERQLRSLRKRVSLLAIVDDGSDRRLAADVAYYPPVPQAMALDWSDSHCTPRIGWEWVLMGSGRSVEPAPPRSAEPLLLVTMGGSDPAGLTVRAARSLSRLNGLFRARFVIGPGMRQEFADQIAAMDRRFEPVVGVNDLSREFAVADLALCAFGVTAYELAAHGVPALYLCLTDDHARSASAFERAGMGLSLGLHDCVEDDEIADATRDLLADTAQRQAMHAAGIMTLDGEGATRVAADLTRLLEERRQTARSAA
ncbi:MAG TPA: NTP transferase domain-containing protein [Rhizomicrobium sp.]